MFTQNGKVSVALYQESVFEQHHNCPMKVDTLIHMAEKSPMTSSILCTRELSMMKTTTIDQTDDID